MEVVITGFDAFSGISKNPSKEIIEELQQQNFSYTNNGNTTGVNKVIFPIIFIYRTLEVSVNNCHDFHDCFTISDSDSGLIKRVFIHLGVDAGGSCIKLVRIMIKLLELIREQFDKHLFI